MAVEGERQARCPACGCFAPLEAFDDAPYEGQARTQCRREDGTLYWSYDEGEDEDWESVVAALEAALDKLCPEDG
jgi:hypothetical protein